jgi:hypothetical protein
VPASDRPIFIVGAPRSGTTLLSLMVHAHPRLAMPPETRFVLRIWRDRHRFGDLSTREQHRALARACVAKGSMVRDLGVSKRELKRRILAAPPTFGSAFAAVFAAYAQVHGKARWGDKRPTYFAEVDVLLRLFPDAQIVHVVRDGRAVVASLKRMPWWEGSSVGAMATWAQAEYCARRDERRLPPDTVHVLRYESLVEDPRGVLRRLCAFLEEDFDEAMLEPHRVAGVVPDRKEWHEGLRSTLTTQRRTTWREGLEPWELGLMETVLRRPLQRRGYDLSLAGDRPSPLAIARLLAALASRHAAMRQRWVRERLDASLSRQPVAARLTSGQRRAGSSG